jgi:hypothetical protein
MDNKRELRCLAAVWALRGILTPEGFKDFKVNDGLVGWDKEELKDLLDYITKRRRHWRQSSSYRAIPAPPYKNQAEFPFLV